MKSGSNIAGAINAAHAAVERAKSEGSRYAIECGKLLSQAKETVRHGEWDRWVKANCSFSARTAQLYMRIYSATQHDPAEAQRVADLGLREAARLVAGPARPAVHANALSSEAQRERDNLLSAWYAAEPEAREMFLRRVAT